MHPRVALIGASGYSGVELTKLLAGHPGVELAVASSDRWVGEAVAARTGVRSSLRYLALDEAVSQAKQCDVALLATPADASHELVPQLLPHARVIDLSGAYRLKSAAASKKFYGFDHKHDGLLAEAIYGLPELYRARIAGARLIANPGCYATAIQLALAPLVLGAREDSSGSVMSAPDARTPRSWSTDARTSPAGWSPDARTPRRPITPLEPATRPFDRASLTDDLLAGRIIVDAMSGVTGAGRKATEEMSFAEVASDVRAYRVLRHQHEPEIEQSLSDLADRAVDITFVPHLLPVQRGILATCHAQLTPLATAVDIAALYEHAYGGEPFITLAPNTESVALHDVVGTNQCRIGISVGEQGELVVIAAIDNLVKGAAGQAVQNLNLLLGLDEQAGLAGLRSFHP
jgi:N-acetyl-gamma-glutamyl-phosphate reductase